MDFRKEQLSMALLREASMGQESQVDALLTQGASPTWQDVSGRDALMMAAWGSSAACVRRLLAAGANARAQDTRGHSALMLAIIASQLEIALDLLPSSDVLALNSEGRGALSLAIEGRHGRCVAAIAQSLPDVLEDHEGLDAAPHFENTVPDVPVVPLSVDSHAPAIASLLTQAHQQAHILARPSSKWTQAQKQGREGFERALDLRLWDCVDALSRQASDKMAKQALAMAQFEGGVLPRLQARMEREELRTVLFEAQSAAAVASSESGSSNSPATLHAQAGALVQDSLTEVLVLTNTVLETIRVVEASVLPARRSNPGVDLDATHAEEQGDARSDGEGEGEGETGGASAAGGKARGGAGVGDAKGTAQGDAGRAIVHSGARRL